MTTPSGTGGSLARDLITGSAPAAARDIDIVLVTGAGASRPFGVNGTELPLMADWADHLVRKLGQGIGYLDMTGLRSGMSGEDFEIHLGRFLQNTQAFQHISTFLGPSLMLPGVAVNPHAMTVQSMTDWHQQTVGHLGQMTGLIYESLYELFGDPSADYGAAASAYGGLFATLGLGADSKLVYATTNYDKVGERAIQDAGAMPDWGAPPPVTPGSEVPIRVAGLLDGLPRYTPVLHLHGRVGWFQRDESVYEANVVRYQAEFGAPLVMLPDPDKDYEQDGMIIAMWQEFSSALARAKRVLVLGHSLNDQFLLRALVQNVQPLERIAVSVLGDDQNPPQPHDSAAPVLAKIQQYLGSAAIVPIRFGRNADEGSVGIRTWTEKLATDGLL
jgi:hypothetical protein